MRLCERERSRSTLPPGGESASIQPLQEGRSGSDSGSMRCGTALSLSIVDFFNESNIMPRSFITDEDKAAPASDQSHKDNVDLVI